MQNYVRVSISIPIRTSHKVTAMARAQDYHEAHAKKIVLKDR